MFSKKNSYYLRFLPLLILAFIAYKLINQTDALYRIYGMLTTLLSPLIWAGVIAYVLNPPLVMAQKYLQLNRLFGVLLVYTLAILLLVGTLLILMPTVVTSITDISSDFPKHVKEINQWATARLQDVRSLEKFVNTYDIKLESLMPSSIPKQISEMTDNLKDLIMSMGRTIFDITSGVFKFIMGLILSLYILLDKENHAKHIKRTMRAFLGEARAQRAIDLLAEIDSVFGKYLIGKMIDSLIIGIICYIGLVLMGVRYSVLFAFVVGITNMIPYFGPFIGAIPTVVVTFFYSPAQSLWVALFILVLQQVDGNFIGPMILGERVGMSPLWIIVAILFGGGLFGVPGMLLGVPVAAVVRNVVGRHVDKVLAESADQPASGD